MSLTCYKYELHNQKKKGFFQNDETKLRTTRFYTPDSEKNTSRIHTDMNSYVQTDDFFWPEAAFSYPLS